MIFDNSGASNIASAVTNEVKRDFYSSSVASMTQQAGVERSILLESWGLRGLLLCRLDVVPSQVHHID